MEKVIGSKTSKLLVVGAGAACACLLATAVAAPQPADAASAMNVDLKIGKTYTAYDVTGDGVADKIKVTYSELAYNEESLEAEYKKTNISVNGEILHTWEAGEGKFYYRDDSVVELLFTSNGNRYLLYRDGDISNVSLYEFADDALREVSMKNKALEAYFHESAADACDSVEAVGKKLRFSYYVYTKAFPRIYFYMDYVVKNHKAVQVGTESVGRWEIHKLQSNVGTLNYSTQVYKDIKCTKKAAKLAKGATIKTGRVVTKGSVAALQIKTSSGATCYLKSPKVWKKSRTMFE